MKILITGGAGTLGSSLIEKFISEGHQVLVIDNFATGKKELVLKSVSIKESNTMPFLIDVLGSTNSSDHYILDNLVLRHSPEQEVKRDLLGFEILQHGFHDKAQGFKKLLSAE